MTETRTTAQLALRMSPFVLLIGFAFTPYLRSLVAPLVTVPAPDLLALSLANTLTMFMLLAIIIDLVIFSALRALFGSEETGLTLDFETEMARADLERSLNDGPTEAKVATMEKLTPKKKQLSRRKLKVSMAIGFGLGLVFALIGFRLIGSVFPSISGGEMANLTDAFDALVTAVVLTGGAEGIHRLTRQAKRFGLADLH